MQQIGCTSKFSIELARGVINDYFILLPDSSIKLRDLPSKAPLFTANFMTALSEIYFNSSKCYFSFTHVNCFIKPMCISVADDKPLIPCDSLLTIITKWVSENSALCYAALTSDLLNSLPLGGIPMPAVTPFVGLFR